MSKRLTRNDILSATDCKTQIVEVPEWGGEVEVKAMSGQERDEWESAMFSLDGKDIKINKDNIRAKLVAKTVVDENGKLMFSDADIAALGQKSSAALDRVYQVSQKLSALTPQDIDELAKNSKSDHSDTSATNSPK